jgi:hypothetical protein
MTLNRAFRRIWVIDFEYAHPPGAWPAPHTLVARELVSGRRVRLFGEALTRRRTPPYPTGGHDLFLCYYGVGDLECHLVLQWPLPCYVLDLFAEFRCRTNGLTLPMGSSLLGALLYYDVAHAVDVTEKKGMRELAMKGPPYTAAERRALLRYCESDVIGLAELFACMRPELEDDAALSRGLLRGRYMRAVAKMEHSGVPLDTDLLARLRAGWTGIKSLLIERVPGASEIYEDGHFREAHFLQWCTQHAIAWPPLPSGRPSLEDKTFRTMGQRCPAVEPIRVLRHALSEMRLEDLHVGPDGRNRTMLSPYRAVSGRNAPSNTAFIFGPAVWLRGLIRPAPGQGLAYCDWEAQEFAIAAVFSDDPAMLEAYQSGDPYLDFAKRANAVPLDATKASHPVIRERYKITCLSVFYGVGPDSLALQLGIGRLDAVALLTAHRRIFKRFWEWSDGVVEMMATTGRLFTVFGWQLQRGTERSTRRFRNWPSQSHGCEMLRLACCWITEAGYTIAAPVHDAVLIEAPIDTLLATTTAVRALMERAAATVLGGFTVRTTATYIRPPDRYMDKRGTAMWTTVMAALAAWEAAQAPRSGDLPKTLPPVDAPY